MVQDQIVDHAVDSRHVDPCADVPRQVQLVTDHLGTAEALVPPTAQLHIQCRPCVAAPSAAWLHALSSSSQVLRAGTDAQQSVQLALPMPASLVVTIRDAVTQQPVAGCTVRLSVLQDAFGNALQAEGRSAHDALDTTTDNSGCSAAFHGCVGALVHAELVSVPDTFLHLDFLDQATEQPRTVRLEGENVLEWVIPQKPRIAICAHDAASGERVIGVRLQVLAVPRSLSKKLSLHSAHDRAHSSRADGAHALDAQPDLPTLITPGASNDGSLLSPECSAECLPQAAMPADCLGTGPQYAAHSEAQTLQERLDAAAALWSQVETWEGEH